MLHALLRNIFQVIWPKIYISWLKRSYDRAFSVHIRTAEWITLKMPQFRLSFTH